ncbi:hypothetical protein OG883_26305 [Streptomyces sp. NBC_01142]|uniref:hypothetical protein n=1 Tax=Streptomyces sp. NBC_01142 TaxID=2975865 RepID=UPI002252F90E|nr:hypothetical protein [Streptomyces sp. NBC_01142]MCX4823333.1 hypothetical protein [Streptomyces sp. NBC_01142]
MRSGLIALRAAGAATVLVLAPAATAAYADDSVKAEVVPSSVAPGGSVKVHVSGCTGTTGAVKSRVFVAAAELSRQDGGDKQLFGDTTVKTAMVVGTYDLDITCDGRDHPASGKVRVVDEKKPDGADEPSSPDEQKPSDGQAEQGGPDEQKPSDEQGGQAELKPPSDGQAGHAEPEARDEHDQAAQPADQDHASPVAPVQAGGGGTASLAAEHAVQENRGPGTPHTVIGLLLAGVAAVAVAFRSARRRRTDAD